jgi:hypothetical protein
VPIIDCYTLTGVWPEAEADLTVEALAAGMQARGVSRSLVTHAAAIFHHQPTGNEQCLQLCARYAPLTPVAVLNPLAYPACLHEAEQLLGRGVQVFRLCPTEHRYPFTSAVGTLRELLRALRAARLLLVDVSTLPAPVLAADLVNQLPAPTAFTVDGHGLGTILHAATVSENVWLESSHLSAGGALEAAVARLSAERIVFGSGSPLRSLGSAVMSVQYAELADTDRAAIFEGNVQRLLATAQP